ncbi:hypothetical protein OMAG_002440 [Candidatus Omnitrophus magneticus]|uniref:Uncharacterized protein n=1 Tax=Candidatus Omnitrophus magneticus TaxID=1609969 RepID=A0A0F0CK76_9BACT|nr:hypothetical protein OMAG_002440 [Candidatus Omnitrophus magneticus]
MLGGSLWLGICGLLLFFFIYTYPIFNVCQIWQWLYIAYPCQIWQRGVNRCRGLYFYLMSLKGKLFRGVSLL